MRVRAQSNGNLNTTPEQTVQMQTVEDGEQAIVIEPADPEMVYVPSYDQRWFTAIPLTLVPHC